MRGHQRTQRLGKDREDLCGKDVSAARRETVHVLTRLVRLKIHDSLKRCVACV